MHPRRRAEDCQRGASPRELITDGYVCEGDSGSGAFVQDSIDRAPVVIGVLSRGFVARGKCSDAKYTRTDTSAKLIVAAALEGARRGDYALPAWATPSGGLGDIDIDDAGRPNDPKNDPYDPYDPDPSGNDPYPSSDPGGSENGNWLETIAELIKKLYDRLDIPAVPGADDTSPEDPTLPVPGKGGPPQDTTPTSDITPAGGDRTGSSNEPGAPSGPGDLTDPGAGGSDSDDESGGDPSEDAETPEPSAGSGCSAASAPVSMSGSGAVLTIAASLLGALRRRRSVRPR